MDPTLLAIAPLASLAASVATIITVAVSAFKYFKHKHTETARASQNLYLELEDTLASLDGRLHPRNFYKVSMTVNESNKIAYFMDRSLNHDFYDSLIYSGRINFLDPPLQQRIQDIFKRIKLHNEYVDVVRRMMEHNDNNVPIAAYKYCEWMDNAEKHLQQELPKILESLKDGFKMNRQTRA